MTEATIQIDPYELILQNPVHFGNTIIDKLTLREPTAKEMRGLKVGGDGLTIGDLLDLGQKLCESNRRVIDSLSKKDALALVEKVSFLFDDGG